MIDSVKFCTSYDGKPYPVLVNSAVSGPRPGIGGALMVGNTLTVYDGSWDPWDAALTHRWLRNDVPILDAVGPMYRLTKADLGKGIRVKTTGMTWPGEALAGPSRQPLPPPLKMSPATWTPQGRPPARPTGPTRSRT